MSWMFINFPENWRTKFIRSQRLSPRKKNFPLIDQIRRSSRSIGAQIAESWAKRRYANHFIRKLTDADAEQYETKHWMEVAFECKLVSGEHLNSICAKCDQINSKLNSMIDKADLFLLQKRGELN